MFCQSCGAEVPDQIHFCPACGASQPNAIGGGVPPAPIPTVPVAYVAPAVVQVRTGHWISAGWAIVKSNLGTFMLMSLLYFLLASCVPLILQGPLLAGLHIACIRKLTQGRCEVGDLFKGFNYFVPAMVAGILSGLLAGVGAVFCIIPGLVIAAMFMFSLLFVVDKRMDFWPAMQASHEIVKKNYVGFTIFMVAAALLNIIGILCLIVGVLATIPILYAAITVAYEEIVGFEPATTKL